MRFDVQEVLTTFGLSSKAESNKEILCPFHNDNNPSATIDTRTGVFHCFGCKKTTGLVQYLAQKFNKSLRDVYATVAKLNGGEQYNALHPRNLEEWHAELWKQKELLEQLHKRHITDELITYYRLGAVSYNGAWEIRIPIWDDWGNVIAVKAYHPGASERKYYWPEISKVNDQKLKGDKSKFLKVNLLYPVEQLAYDQIILCGGELKAVAAASVLNKHGIGAISLTGSENSGIHITLVNRFERKKVYVCYDVDRTGLTQSHDRCKDLRNTVVKENLHRLDLPLNPEEYPHGDINDFLAIGGDLLKLIEEAKPWNPEDALALTLKKEPLDDEIHVVTLDQAVVGSMSKKRVQLNAVVSSMDTSPFLIPKQVRIHCNSKTDYCEICKLKGCIDPIDGYLVELKSDQIELIELVNEDKRKHEVVICKAFGIPTRCLTVSFETVSNYTIEDVRISQQLDITSRTSERSMQIAYCVGETKVELNEPYTMVGRVYPHPRNQQAALLVNEYHTTQDALSTYEPQHLDKLKIFQPETWTVEEIQAKLDDIYTDFAANVTWIYNRQPYHLVVDLAYHSPLFIPFENQQQKGWLEALVIGDSGIGKSKVIERLAAFYKLGERVVCKGATVAGLLGGVQQFGKRWFASWGKIPTHDRRLVVLEEVKGARIEVIAALTDMRSAGIAELTKIEKRRTNARTRLVWISNPRSERTVDTYNYGVDIVRELIGNPEDVRRFDIVQILERSEVLAEDIREVRNKLKGTPHRYTEDLCRELILFAWTARNIVFEDEDYVIDKAVGMCRGYSSDVPIIDESSFREKLARLAAALAIRTFSVEDKQVIIRKVHVDYIVQFLDQIYNTTAFGYKLYSNKIHGMETLENPEEIKLHIMNRTPFPKVFVSRLLITDQIDLQFIQDLLGWDMKDARNLLSFLNVHKALVRQDRNYRKTAKFTELLKEMEKMKSGRPEHIPEEF